MAWINKYTFGLINAYAMRERFGGGEFAVFMRQQSTNQAEAPVISYVARHAPGLSDWSTNTAIVNGIQNGALDNHLVFTTYVPAVACIGAMKTHGLNSVTYIDGTGQPRIQAVRANPNVNNINPQALPQTAGNNRFTVPRAYLPPLALASNTIQGGQAVRYLKSIVRSGPLAIGGAAPCLEAWRGSWNGLGPSDVVGAREAPALREVVNASAGIAQELADFLYMALVYSIAGRAAGPDYQGARIAGVIASRTGRIYSWHVNQREINTTYHAETNAVQAFGAPIPADATLYSTLEPCHQCAAMFVRAGGQRCVFGQHDPNMTNNTALHAASTRFQATSTLADDLLPELVIGDRLDEILVHSTAANQAAAVALARYAQEPANPRAPLSDDAKKAAWARMDQDAEPFHNPRNAIQLARPGNLKTRVLDILNSPPTRDLWRGADEMLDSFITHIRQNPNHYPQGSSLGRFVDSCAQVRAALY